MGVRSHIRVHFLLEILSGAEVGWSHKTSRSYNRGSYNAGTNLSHLEKDFIQNALLRKHGESTLTIEISTLFISN